MEALPDRAPRCSYEEAVVWLRRQPEFRELVVNAYLGEDNREAAGRFIESGEWKESHRVLDLGGARKLSVLDVGCGNGISSHAFRSSGHRVTALDVDMSGDVGLLATRRLAGGGTGGSVHCVGGVAERLPFRSGSFDLVYARQALHHFRDLEGGLGECARVLRRGGRFLAAREHVVSDDAQLEEFLDAHPLQPLHGGERAYPVETYRRAMARAGLRMDAVLGPYDSPINQFPTTDEEIRSWMRLGLARRFGPVLSAIASRVPLPLALYKRRLSRICQYPGRLYSFVGEKP